MLIGTRGCGRRAEAVAGRPDRGRAQSSNARRACGRLAGEEEIDADGCALLPGLHDHHVHLRALAAAQASVQVGPEQVRSAAELAARLREADAAAPPGAWLRCVGYHESVAGPLDRWALDRLLADPARPGARVQHRTGALWVVNSAALAALGLDADAPGRPGRLSRGGARRRRPGDRATVADGPLARRPRSRAAGRSRRRPRLGERAGRRPRRHRLHRRHPRRDRSATSPAWPPRRPTARSRSACTAWRAPTFALRVPGARGRFSIGPVKIMLDDDTLPSLDELADSVRQAHAAGRTVAVHCVTRVQLVLTLAALDAGRAGAGRPDRARRRDPGRAGACAARAHGRQPAALRGRAGGAVRAATSRPRTFLTCGGCAA